jgi:hypothetical protein
MRPHLVHDTLQALRSSDAVRLAVIVLSLFFIATAGMVSQAGTDDSTVTTDPDVQEVIVSKSIKRGSDRIP